ncbi:signal recognition particle 9 kDa protein-like [Artemia franciscana]|uniref:signal recognition particle 9 kDa protein-like n=1 Tax=Artemia franciscana TaxID=6661 RepID=UPI0032D9CFEE
MPAYKDWKEFERLAETLYLQNPSKVRYTIKYAHDNGMVIVKVTDDATCLKFETDSNEDMKKIDKFMANLTRHMASKEVQ